MVNKLKTGELTTVRDCEGKLLVRRVIRICGNLVFVSSDEELASAKIQGRDPLSVAWPIEDAGL